MPEVAHGNQRFYVSINGMTEAVFTEVSGLQAETVIMEYEEGGNNTFVHKLPGRVKVGNLTLKRGIAKSDKLLKWFLDVVKGQIKREHVTVAICDTEGKAVETWVFVEAFPVKWTGPQLTANGTAIAVETLELAHNGLQLK